MAMAQALAFAAAAARRSAARVGAMVALGGAAKAGSRWARPSCENAAKRDAQDLADQEGHERVTHVAARKRLEERLRSIQRCPQPVRCCGRHSWVDRPQWDTPRTNTTWKKSAKR
mmetsp:Transcript_1142/g.7443  ORF Transcript_1142/g.7443 Transcript_1142/m.7443 type:complete len:115 (+) Transcript_1142:13-357(+)